MSGYAGRSRPSPNGTSAPSVQRSYASQLREHEPLFHTYEHLQGLSRGDAALTMLRKVASLVKPIMRKHEWRVQVLAEFLPAEPNLLGLNINRGHKICLRLRYHNHPDLFLPVEQVVDTLLHELSHNVWGAHDDRFHRLWDQLRAEHDVLVSKGYTGEGFLSEGQTLGGGRVPPPHEMRRLARASAEKRQAQSALGKGSGRRLGGTPLHLLAGGGDVRRVIADQVTRRNTIDRGCGSGRTDAVKLSDDAASRTFRTAAEEDDANDRAIARALYELIEEEEERKLRGTFAAAPAHGGLAWHPENGLYDPGEASQQPHPSEEEQLKWALRASVVAAPSSSSSDADEYFPTPLSAQPPPVPFESRPTESHDSSAPTRVSIAVSDFTPISPDSTSPPQRHPIDATTNATSDNQDDDDPTPLIDLSEPFDPTTPPTDQWACSICTCINPRQFLACDACGGERPQSVGIGNRPLRPPRVAARAVSGDGDGGGGRDGSLGWNCTACGAFMEHLWWTCSACGKMKESS